MVWFQIIWKKREIPERNEKSSKVAKLFELKSILTFMVLQIKFNSSQPGVLKSKQQGNDWKWLSQKMHYEGILARQFFVQWKQPAKFAGCWVLYLQPWPTVQQMCVCTYLTCVQIYCTVGRWRVCFKQVKHSPHPVEHFGNILSEYATGQSLLYFIVVAYSLFKALTKKKNFQVISNRMIICG